VSINRDRARGCLLGLAVGDALGTTLEFSHTSAPAFPVLATGPHREVLGGGPFGVKPGQCTDDTHMACCLAASLRELGRFDAGDVAHRYVEWREIAFDVGGQTGASLSAVALGTSPEDAGREVWMRRDRNPAGNGSLMRTAPIGVFFATDLEARRGAVLGDSAITHFDPRCQIACASFNAAISTAITDSSATPARLLRTANEEIDLAAEVLLKSLSDEKATVEDARITLQEDLRAAQEDDPKLYGPELHLHRTQGFVRVAFRLAFWELLHAPTFESALIDVVNRGGDADTNGAIVGALLGAFFGEAAIPERWKPVVLAALQDGQPGPFRDIYHPRQLLQLVED
jgi:ADP-ribosyl-[dinitrogen reductase] hydrolase